MHEYDDHAAEDERCLTDADVQALADELENRLVNRFYKNLGRGVWSMVWRALVFVLVGLASYGAIRGFKP